MTEILTEESFAEQPWSDVQLPGLHWAGTGRDLVLTLRTLSSETDREHRERTLHCRWARNLRVDLSYPSNAGGYPLTWDVCAEKTSSGEWSISFDFTSKRTVSFYCSEVELRDL